MISIVIYIFMAMLMLPGAPTVREVDKSVDSGYCMELPNYQLRAIRGMLGKTIERGKTIGSGLGSGIGRD